MEITNVGTGGQEDSERKRDVFEPRNIDKVQNSNIEVRLKLIANV